MDWHAKLARRGGIFRSASNAIKHEHFSWILSYFWCTSGCVVMYVLVSHKNHRKVVRFSCSNSRLSPVRFLRYQAEIQRGKTNGSLRELNPYDHRIPLERGKNKQTTTLLDGNRTRPLIEPKPTIYQLSHWNSWPHAPVFRYQLL